MKYFLFGAGEYGKRTIALLGKENITMIFDNNSMKWGSLLGGIPVQGFYDSKSLLHDECIIISVSPEKAVDIIKQLGDNGIDNFMLYEELVKKITKEKILSRTDYIDVYKKAINWIKDNSIEKEGIICQTNLRKSYPEVSGYFIPTLLRWGYRKLACSYAEWLCSVQKQDGSWYDTEDEDPYIFDTAQVLKGLLAIRTIMPKVDPHIIKGCEWIFAQMQENGRLITPTKKAWGEDCNMCDEVIHIYCLSPLYEAAEVFDKPEFKEKTQQIWGYYKQNYYEKIMNFSLLSHFYAYLMEALLDIGELNMAKEAMLKMEAYQKPSGAVPAYKQCDWVCSTGLFQLSLVWFRLGDIDRGNRAFEYACKLQNKSGGWFGSYLSENNLSETNTYIPSGEISWAIKFFLDALYYKNVAEFEANCNDFLPSIEKNDDRYQVIFREVCSLSENREIRILDVGCGKGRYLKNLVDDFPNNVYDAVDISENVMKFFDLDSVTKKQGSLTNIPYEDNSFDIVYACESLEHAIDVESAMQELGRVIKSGGRIVIIDKNLKALGQMEICPWEQWFDEKELKKIMEQHCTDVIVCPEISYDGKIADGLFCAWIGKAK